MVIAMLFAACGEAPAGVRRALWAVTDGEKIAHDALNSPLRKRNSVGEEKLHPEEDRGIAGPVSTVQLANFRRGLQDHLILTMARRFGLNEVVERSLRATVPRMFSDAAREVGFAENGNAYETARREVARAIAR